MNQYVVNQRMRVRRETWCCFASSVRVVLVVSQVMKSLNRAASVALVFGRVKVCPQVVQRQRGRCLLVVPCFVERAEHTGQVGLIFLIAP